MSRPGWGAWARTPHPGCWEPLNGVEQGVGTWLSSWDLSAECRVTTGRLLLVRDAGVPARPWAGPVDAGRSDPQPLPCSERRVDFLHNPLPPQVPLYPPARSDRTSLARSCGPLHQLPVLSEWGALGRLSGQGRAFPCNLCVFSFSAAANWVHGKLSLLQRHRRRSAAVLGECPEVLFTAHNPRGDRLAAGRINSMNR